MPEQVQSNKSPLVSVVIPSVNGMPTLAECIESLMQQTSGSDAEIIVIDRCGAEVQNEIRSRFPNVNVVAVECSSSIPAMRTLGISHARGSVIAITKDHCIARPNWLKSIEAALVEGHKAVGGAVENGSVERNVDWAVFFCEYASFMEPVPRGIASQIPGINSAYHRTILDDVRPELNLWEPFWHNRMRELGVAFFSNPDMVVVHKKRFGYLYFLSQRFHFARSFAAMRVTKWRWLKRLAYACATTILPAILLKRISTTVFKKGRHQVRFIMSLPILCTFLLSWAVGESVGSLLGPGQSLQRVE